MKWIGLTGGIGSGKSQVATFLHHRGYFVVDADELARQVVQPGTPGLTLIVETFGQDFLKPDGSLDREAMGNLVFSNPQALIRLEGLLHPLIQSEANKLKIMLQAKEAEAGFYDVPLLFEKNLSERFDATVCVYCKPETQIHRVMVRDKLSREDVEKRLAKQLPMADKAQLADYVIMNEGSLSELEFEVNKMLDYFKLSAYQAQE